MDSLLALRQHYLDQPHEVSFETLAVCNAACVFCPYSTLERQGAQLPSSTIRSLIDQMSFWPKPFYVSPFKVNEPFLDSRLPQLCRDVEAECPEATLRLFTNGHPLTERQLEWVARLKKLDCLWISLNSTDPQEYGERMKVSYSVVRQKLDTLHEWMQTQRFPHRVVVSRVMTGECDIDPDCASAPLRGDRKDAFFINAVRRTWPRFEPFLIKRDAWLGYVDPSDARVPQAPCARWFELNITATGKAVLCCMDGEEKYVLGDVSTQSLLDIYNQPVLRARRAHALSREGIDPC